LIISRSVLILLTRLSNVNICWAEEDFMSDL